MKKDVAFHLTIRETMLISLLILLLRLPAVFGASWSNSGEVERQENRKIANCPDVSQLREDPEKFIQALDAYVNDRIFAMQRTRSTER